MAFPYVYMCSVLIPRPASSMYPLPKQPPFLLSCHVYSFTLSRSLPTFRPMWSFKCGTNPETEAVRSLRDIEDVWGDRHSAGLGSSVWLRDVKTQLGKISIWTLLLLDTRLCATFKGLQGWLRAWEHTASAEVLLHSACLVPTLGASQPPTAPAPSGQMPSSGPQAPHTVFTHTDS